jgi:hypothetical protein
VVTWHCNVCGLFYQFAPPEKIEAPAAPKGMLQTQPGIYVTLKSSSIFADNDDG